MSYTPFPAYQHAPFSFFMAFKKKKIMKGVCYFHHYPKNFSKPYGRAEPYPTDTVALSCLGPEGCKWLRRPHVAISELASTINDNLPVLDADLALLDDRKLSSFKQNIEKLAILLQQFHKDSSVIPTDGERRDLLLKILNLSAELSS
eukprot:gene11054-19910_t